MKETSKIYVDIESLLDVRQAILYTLCPDQDKLMAYLDSEEYNFRQTDTFSIVDSSTYNKAYQSRSTDILPYSTITHILVSLKTKLANLEKRNIYYGETKTPEVVLNIYPFTLTTEHIDQIQNLLFVKLETNTLVTITSISPLELSPYFIKNGSFTACFIYNFSEWMNFHSKSLETNKLTDTVLYFPAIYVNYDEKEQEKIVKLGFKDVFNYTEFLLSSVANINFLPTVFYSNLITASRYLKRFNQELKDTDLTQDSEEFDGNIIPEV